MSVLPISADKRPLLPAWATYQVRHPTDAELRSWWPPGDASRGLGIVLGRVSNLIALDIEHDALAVLDDFDVPDTAIAATQRGGVHVYFRFAEGSVTRTVTREGRHCGELRADRSYVAAPPTSGRFGPYRWLRERPLNALPEAPSWVLALPGEGAPSDLHARTMTRHTHVSPRPSSAARASRSEADEALAVDLAQRGVDAEVIAALVLQRPAAQDRGSHAAAYVASTVEKARAWASAHMRDTVITRVAIDPTEVRVTFEVLGAGGARRELHFDYPPTTRSTERWRSLTAAARVPYDRPDALFGARLRVEWLRTDRGFRVGRFYAPLGGRER